MQNIDQQGQEPDRNLPQVNSKAFQPPIINTRFNNKLIYDTYLRKDYKKCLSIIGNSKNNNEFQLYISACIERDLINIQKSQDLFKQCHIMDKLNFDYLKNISKTMFLLGKFKSSMEAGNQAVKLRKDWQIFHIFGKVNLALNDKQTAIKNFQESINIDPNQDSYMELSKIYMLNGRMEKAYSLLKEASKYSPQNSEIISNLGLLAIKLGKKEEAISNFQAALSLDNFNYDALLGYGSILQQNNQIDKAMMKYKFAYSKSPNSAFLWNNIGMCLFQKKKLIAAYACLKKAIFLDPFQWMTYANLGIVCIQLHKYTSSFINFNIAISMNPKDFKLFMYLGIALMNLKDYANSERAYIESLSLQQSGLTYLNYAIMLLKKGDYKKSREKITIVTQKYSNVNKQLVKKVLQILNNV